MERSELFLARRYAQAYLEGFYHVLVPEDVSAFERAHTFFKEHQPACFLMDLTLLAASAKEKALMHFIERFKLPGSCYELMSLIITHHRASLLGMVFHQLAHLYQQRAGIMSFIVQSSVVLEAQERLTIENFLKEQLHAQIECTYELKQELIAGVRIFNEQYLWEYSAQAQLRALYTSVRS
jgi:F0F1-type ATP synthase delta subunit